MEKQFDQLPQGAQLIIQLFYYEDMSHDEIAYHLGINPSTSRTQLSRAMARLKKQMEHSDEG